MLRGRFGRSLRAVRDSELAAASSGVNLARYKTLAFGISAFYAGVAGSLLAIATTFVNPDTFPVALSIFLLVGVVVGGLGSLWPLVFGAIFIHFMQIEWAQQVESVIPNWLPLLGDIDTDAAGAPAVAFGVILILIMLVAPGGAAGLLVNPQGAYDPRLPSPSHRVGPAARLARAVRSQRVPRPERPVIRGSRRQTIVLGATAPLSGPESAAVRGAGAYFRYVNARGGVNGRSIVYKVVDDASDPAQALQATEQLVGQDAVFAIVNAAGTEQNLAVRDYLNRRRCRSSSSTPGRRRSGPTTGGIRGRSASGRAATRKDGCTAATSPARDPARRSRSCTEAMLRARSCLPGFGEGLAGSKARVVAAQAVDATVPDLPAAQVAEPEGLGRERACALRRLSPRRSGLRARRPARLAAVDRRRLAGSTVEGAVSITFLKDPSDAKWRNDTAMKLYRAIISKYAKGANGRTSTTSTAWRWPTRR